MKPLKLYVFKLFTVIAYNHYSGGFRGPPLQSCKNVKIKLTQTPSGKESVQMRVLIINWDLSALDKFQWSSMKKNLGFNGVTYIENPF